MAEPVSAADKALKKLADQLECSICLESFTNPKLLQCFHVFCKDCLEPLVLRDQHEPSRLHCPTCRRSTLLPANGGVSDLQPAFHINHLFEIRDAFQKVRPGQEGQKPQCEECKKREANGFCRDCSRVLCEVCIGMHHTWEEYSIHKVISLEQLKSDTAEISPPSKKIRYCSKHPGKELELFCETDEELICHDCIVETHQDHQYELISMIFPKHRATIASHLEPVKQHLNTVSNAIQDLGTAQDQIMDQRAVIEADIQNEIRQLHEVLEVRKNELIGQLEHMTQQKLKILSFQRDELELMQSRLNSCLEFVNDSLKTGSEAEILAMEKPVVQQVKEMCSEFNHDQLSLQEHADICFTATDELTSSCLQFGEVYQKRICPPKCYATRKRTESLTVGEESTVTMHAVDTQGSNCAKSLPLTSISCELESCIDDDEERIKCEVKPSKPCEYEINYQPIHRGRHQLHIKVSDQHIRGSPFTLLARGKLDTPVRTIVGPNRPWGVAINDKGEIVIAERERHCISIYSPSGEKIKSFGQKGSSPGQFNFLHGVAVDRAGYIIAVDGGSNHIQKFTSDGVFVGLVGSKSNKQCQLDDLVGIGISPTDKVYVCDRRSHRVQTLNSDLSFSTSFGIRGHGDGQFQCPLDVAFDSRGNVYVADSGNHRIQVFTEDGRFLRKFGIEGKGEGELESPFSVAIDSDDVVYVSELKKHHISLFTSKGRFLRSFGAHGKGPGCFNQPHGIAIDKDGYVYICDFDNNRVQVW